MTIQRQKILAFWAATTAIPRIQLLDFGPVGRKMTTPEWQLLGSKEQLRLLRSLSSDRTHALAQTLAARKVNGDAPASYTELANILWGPEDGNYTFDNKRMAITKSYKTLKYFGLAEGDVGAPYKEAQVEATEELLYFVDELGESLAEIASDFLESEQ